MIFSLFERLKRRQSRQLNRDVLVIIEQAKTMFADKTLSQIAGIVSTEMHTAHNVFGQKLVDLRRAHYEYRKRHKEARRSNNQAELTAMTLVIIHLRAEIAGIDAKPARASIEQFVAQYK